MLTTWREKITEEMRRNGESWPDVVANTLTADQLDDEFDAGPGHPEGLPFALYTEEFCYFPTVHDGVEDVGSVPRDPDGDPIRHIGRY